MALKPVPEHLRVPWSAWSGIGIFLLAWIVLPVAFVYGIVWLAPFNHGISQLLDSLRNADSASNATANLVVSFVVDVLTVALAAGLVTLTLRKYKLTWAAVGWRTFNWRKATLYLVIGFVGFLVLSTLLLALASWLDPTFNSNQAQTNDFTGSVHTHWILSLLALVILPPIIEETVFRGYIFPAIAKKWGTVWGAIAASVLFGLAHWQANVSIYTFGLGLVLCFLYVKLKSIFPGMIIHMLNNLLAFLALSSMK